MYNFWSNICLMELWNIFWTKNKYLRWIPSSQLNFEKSTQNILKWYLKFLDIWLAEIYNAFDRLNYLGLWLVEFFWILVGLKYSCFWLFRSLIGLESSGFSLVKLFSSLIVLEFSGFSLVENLLNNNQHKYNNFEKSINENHWYSKSSNQFNIIHFH